MPLALDAIAGRLEAYLSRETGNAATVSGLRALAGGASRAAIAIDYLHRGRRAGTIAAGPGNPAWEHVRKTAAEKLLVANRSPAAAASGAAAMSPMILDGDPSRWPGQE